jgi:hypothetical protein
MNREPIQDPKLDDMLTSWRTDPGDKRPQLQRAIWDHLRKNVYRITQSYVHAGGKPYCWFPGYCSYEAKTAWLTTAAPARKSDKFAQ